MALSAEYQFIQPTERSSTGRFIEREYSLDEIGFFTSACTRIDTELLAMLHADPNNPIVFPLFDKKTTEKTNEALMMHLAHTLRHDQAMITASIYYGAYRPLSQLLNTVPDREKHLLPIVVMSTEGNQRKHSRIMTPLGDLLRTDRNIDLIDEVADSMSTVATIVQARRAARLLDQYPEADGALPLRLHEQFYKESYDEAKPFYAQLTQHLIEENIALAIPVYKNKPFLEILRHAAHTDDSAWGERQRRYADNVLPVNKKIWALGKGMDALLKGTALKALFSPNFQKDHPLITKIGDFNFRIGSSLEEIAGLRSLDALYQFSATILEDHTKVWLRN